MDTRKFQPEAIAILASKAVDSAVRSVTQTPIPLQHKYRHWQRKDITSILDSRHDPSMNPNQKIDKFDQTCWKVFESYSVVQDDASRAITKHDILQQALSEIADGRHIDREIIDDQLCILHPNSMESDVISWGSFLIIAKEMLLNQPILPAAISRPSTKQRHLINTLFNNTGSNNIPSPSYIDKPSGKVGYDPTASTLQIDDIYYHKRLVHTAVIDTIRSESRAYRKKSSVNCTPRNMEYHDTIKSTSPRASDRNMHTPRIKNSVSTSASERRRRSIHQTLPPTKTIDILPEKHVPGLYFDYEEPPNYALPTATQKIAGMVNPSHSFPEKWNKKKMLYDERVKREQHNRERKIMRQGFEHLINVIERNTAGDVLNKVRSDQQQENERRRNTILEKKEMGRKQLNDWKQEMMSIKEYDIKAMNSMIQSSIEERNSEHECELAQLAALRPQPITKLPHHSSIIINKPYEQMESMSLSKEYERSVVSERLSIYAQLRTDAIINAARSDVKISVKPIRGEDYFIDPSSTKSRVKPQKALRSKQRAR